MNRYRDNSRFTNKWLLGQIGNFNRNLAELAGKPITALEIGSYEGRSACYLMEEIITHCDSRLLCIDPHNYDAVKSYNHTPRLREQLTLSALQRFRNNTDIWMDTGKLLHIMSPSHVALRDRVRLPLDFVYVDGSHYGSDCLTDMVLSWTLLKQGAIMGVDDVQWKPAAGSFKNPRIACPKLAVHFFRRLFYGQFARLPSSSKQFWIRRTAVNNMLPKMTE